MTESTENSQYWADQKANEILTRKKFHYLENEIPEFEHYTIKTSASISGVLHIGRLSDTIRSESVMRALLDQGQDARLIWVAEDMDPLRKIPEGVPAEYSEYIGVPVTEIPDPWGCHDTYAEHHVSKYLEVLHEFTSTDFQTFSMREEYKKGNFKEYVRNILNNINTVKEIQNKYRQNPLPEGWSPWTPICKECGKIITPRIEKYDGKSVHYKCQDYQFEKTLAKGCGYEGVADPVKDPGKLMWKAEWASQWARWKVASEGAGKEYVVPSSAWWVNGEIVEKIHGFPMPVPIFYEHLMIDNTKMSASLGNVVYPHDWLEVAPAQLLKFFYNKKLMKTRSFSWTFLPNLYDEYDRHGRVYYDLEQIPNEKESSHMKRLFEISQIKENDRPMDIPFSHAAVVAQLFPDEEGTIKSLKRSGHFQEEKKDDILKRISFARTWAEKYAPPELKTSILEDVMAVKDKITPEQLGFLKELSSFLQEGEKTGDEVMQFIYDTSKALGLKPGNSFIAIYMAILGKTRGPKAGPFLASLDKEWLVERFRQI